MPPPLGAGMLPPTLGAGMPPPTLGAPPSSLGGGVLPPSPQGPLGFQAESAAPHGGLHIRVTSQEKEAIDRVS